MSDKTKTIVVLGVGRGGTSLAAGLLKLFGVDMGPTIHPTKFNPKGSFEDEDFVEMNKKILNNPNSDFSSEVENLIQTKSKDKIFWGWKVPSTVLTIKHYLPYLPNPYFVIVLRNPIDNALSMVKYSRENRVDFPHPISFIEALRRVCQTYERILIITQQYPEVPQIFISFERIIKNPVAEIRRISEFLGIHISNQQIEKIKKFIIPEPQKGKERKKGEVRRIFHFIKKCFRNPYKVPDYLKRALKNNFFHS